MSSILGWGSSGTSEFDTLLDQTTASTLPSSSPPSLPSSLHLADLIRSNRIPPLAATKSLLKRLSSENGTTQLLTIGVIDICIKNGGNPFLLTITDSATTEFTTTIERIIRQGGNYDVRELLKAKFGDWVGAFEGKDNLRESDLGRAYRRLVRDGIEFPQRDPNVTAAMVDSLSAPEWSDSPYCTRCRTAFTMTNRKHHCRNCGNVFDQACSKNLLSLPHYGILEPVRVCDSCTKKLKEGRGKDGLGRSSSLGNGGVGRLGLPERSSTISSRSRESKSKEDTDLERAIKASLNDVGPSGTNGPDFERRTNPRSSYNQAPPQNARVSNAGDEDPDLAAAIAASLREVALSPSAPPPQSANEYNPYSQPQQRYAPYGQPAMNSYNDPQARSQGYGQSQYSTAPPNAYDARGRAEVVERRKEILEEMEKNLREARIYQGMLESEQAPNQYAPQQPYGYPQQPYAPQQQQQQAPYEQPYTPSLYPTIPSQPYGTYASPASAQQQQPGLTSPYQQQAYPDYPTTQPQAAYGAQQQQQAYPTSPIPQQQQQQQPLYSPPAQQQGSYFVPPIAAATQEPPFHPEASYAPPPSTQQPQQAQSQPQQPAGYYKPSSFPALPASLVLPATTVEFPSVPVENPWEEDRLKAKKEEEVGELIQF